MKQCRKCLSFKQEDQFYKNSLNKTGFSYQCKICHLKEGKEYRLNNLNKIHLRKAASESV
jgi:predicted SprT family Zn-dependent metalloprotease